MCTHQNMPLEMHRSFFMALHLVAMRESTDYCKRHNMEIPHLIPTSYTVKVHRKHIYSMHHQEHNMKHHWCDGL
jgi:hypothetical protein